MDYVEKFKKAQFYFNNPSLNRWRKYEFDYKQYIKFKQKWLSENEFKTILDIGANVGQSAIALSLAYPQASIHSFEPLPDCFEKLQNVSQLLSNIIAHNYALGSKAGELSFEHNAYSASSSLLKITDNHHKHFPHTESVIMTKVPVARLDDLAKKLDIQKNIMIKMDVQGYEYEVIRGATNILSKTKVVIMETSFETLYEEQPLFEEIYKAMTDLGFYYCGSFDQLISPKTDQVLQQDAIFVRK